MWWFRFRKHGWTTSSPTVESLLLDKDTRLRGLELFKGTLLDEKPKDIVSYNLFRFGEDRHDPFHHLEVFATTGIWLLDPEVIRKIATANMPAMQQQLGTELQKFHETCSKVIEDAQQRSGNKGGKDAFK